MVRDWKLLPTADGSATLVSAELGEVYHSRHGALTESEHVFVRHGLATALRPAPVRVLEVGLGTGLNAWLTAAWAEQERVEVHYLALEPHPVPATLRAQLPDPTSLRPSTPVGLWPRLGLVPPETPLVALSPHFRFCWTQQGLPDLTLPPESFTVVYFDAFAPTVQPELWTPATFGPLLAALVPGGVLVTYCAKGEVRRALQSVGFTVERRPGPPGKREMLRATRPVSGLPLPAPPC